MTDDGSPGEEAREHVHRFDRQSLHGATFRGVDLTGATLRDCDLTGVVMRGVELVDVVISGEVSNVVVNGVDVAPLVRAELVRREPDLAKMTPTDPDGYREAWAILERRWAQTVARARTLPPELLHASVDDEWSFTQTLRHLVFATDIWVSRVLHGDPRPWHPLGLPYDEMEPHPDIPWDRDARPSLEEVLAVRESRTARVRTLIEGLTQAGLDAVTTPVDGPGWPPARARRVGDCLDVVLNEEWWHRQFAERDLDALVLGQA